VIGGKPITVCADNPLVTFYGIHGRKKNPLLLFYPGHHTRQKFNLNLIFKLSLILLSEYQILNVEAFATPSGTKHERYISSMFIYLI
jgi:hypothetical protein